jgi:hypothetical protein
MWVWLAWPLGWRFLLSFNRAKHVMGGGREVEEQRAHAIFHVCLEPIKNAHIDYDAPS